jgi:hypothetical protein
MSPSVSESRIGSQGLKVLLVHGTWARGIIRKTPVARWCRPDSYFVGQLLDELEERLPTVSPTITAINWCGSNSIMCRAEAANNLKNQLQTLAAEGGPILIIGHSHGGNVVLQATSKLCDLSKVYVCTLATPFLQLFESERRFTAARTLLTILSLAACIPLAIVLGVVCSAAVAPTAYILGTALLMGFPFAGFVCGLIGGRLLFRLVINPIPKSGTPTHWQLRSRKLCEATAADARLLTNHLLILRGIDDEAALSLAAGAVANRLLRVTYAASIKLMSPFSFSLSGLPRWGLILLAFSPGTVIAPLLLVFLLLLILFGPVGAAIGMTVLFFIPVLAIFLVPLTRTVFGRELAVGSMGCDAFFDSVPDSDLATTITLGQRKDETLSHSLYEHPLAAPTIANWIAGHLKH